MPRAPPVTTPARPARSILFIRVSLCWGSKHASAGEDEGLAGGEDRFVGGEIHEHRRDVVDGAEPAHRLAGDEVLARLHRVGEGVDAALERGRVARARAES